MKYRLRMLFIHPVLLFIMFGVFYVFYYCNRRHRRLVEKTARIINVSTYVFHFLFMYIIRVCACAVHSADVACLRPVEA